MPRRAHMLKKEFHQKLMKLTVEASEDDHYGFLTPEMRKTLHSSLELLNLFTLIKITCQYNRCMA